MYGRIPGDDRVQRKAMEVSPVSGRRRCFRADRTSPASRFQGCPPLAADLAGIRLETGDDRKFRDELAIRKRERERLEATARRIQDAARELRHAHREALHELEKLAHRTARQNRDGRHDALLARLPELIRRDAAAYLILAFGDVRVRVKFVLNPECRRRAVDAVLAALVRDVDGRVLEVTT